MSTNFDSSTVASGTDATATQYNDLRKDVLRNAGDFEVSTGSANAYLLAVDSAISAYAAGDVFKFKANFANTGTATINVNSIGAITIKKPDGFELGANDIILNQLVVVQYDGTYMQMLSPIGQIFSPVTATVLASDDLIQSADTERSSGVAFNSGDIKLKEIRINVAGTYRFTWDYRATGGGFTAKTQIYKNGSPVGVEKTTTSTVYIAASDDVSNWAAGDLAQLYVNDDNDSGEQAFIRNFRVNARVAPVATVITD